MGKPKLIIRLAGAEKPREVVGRYAWTLAELLRAGKQGVTPIERPAPRWSHYVHKLRTEHGITIETIDEPHGGAFPGTHGRYVLHTPIEVLERVGV